MVAVRLLKAKDNVCKLASVLPKSVGIGPTTPIFIVVKFTGGKKFYTLSGIDHGAKD